MPLRPTYYDDYWKKLNKDSGKTIRTTCPQCGSSETYYNARFKVWRCVRCEHSFTIKGLEERPWWKRVLVFWKR